MSSVRELGHLTTNDFTWAQQLVGSLLQYSNCTLVNMIYAKARDGLNSLIS